MPEGDTIFRTARTLARALTGRAVTRFGSVFPALTRIDDDQPIAGRTVESVRSIGKHLLIQFSGGLVLRTHMRMNGSWHLYRPGERWRRPASAMRVVIATDAWVAVAFNVQVAEFIAAREIGRHPGLARLGPDLLAADFDERDAVSRLLASERDQVGEALLDQRVMAGIGNVFKSEILFVAGIDPFRPPGSLSAEEAGRIVQTARRLLEANVLDPAAIGTPVPPGRRTTHFAQPSAALWVYGRHARPCRRCGTPVMLRKQEPFARLTYWCPRCQR